MIFPEKLYIIIEYPRKKGAKATKKVISLIKKLLSVQAVRCMMSSCAALAVDYTILLILEAVLSPLVPAAMEISAVVAFLFSSQVNFWMNRIWVFQSKKPPLPELWGYYSLVLISFSFKTFVLLELLVRVLRLPLMFAKPIVEVSMFAVNFMVQRAVIFKRKE